MTLKKEKPTAPTARAISRGGGGGGGALLLESAVRGGGRGGIRSPSLND